MNSLVGFDLKRSCPVLFIHVLFLFQELYFEFSSMYLLPFQMNTEPWTQYLVCNNCLGYDINVNNNFNHVRYQIASLLLHSKFVL